MDVKFYLKRPNDDRVTNIYARIVYNMSEFKYYLIEKIHPADWNPKTQCAKHTARFSESLEFNQRLKEVKGKIADAFYNYQNTHQGKQPTPEIFKQVLDEIFNKQSQARIDRELQRTFWGFFENFISRMESGSRVHLQKNTPLAESTIKNMRNLKNHLLDYQAYSHRGLEFDTIDMTFYYGFTDYLTKVKKVNINSIGKLITNTKVLMREALEAGYTSNTIFTHRKFRSASAESETVYLSENEIEQLQGLDLSGQKKLERVRDLFIIGCYTGLRYSDLSKLTIDKIDDDILEVAQTKTGDRVHIPLRSEVKALIEKYDGQFPRAISNQKFNEYLRDACKQCKLLEKEVSIKTFEAGKRVTLVKPKYLFVKSHTARRSFATNEYLAHDLQTAEIRSITGHKTDKSFYKYIRVTPRENAENVAKKWKERELKKLRVVEAATQLKAV